MSEYASDYDNDGDTDFEDYRAWFYASFDEDEVDDLWAMFNP